MRNSKLLTFLIYLIVKLPSQKFILQMILNWHKGNLIYLPFFFFFVLPSLTGLDLLYVHTHFTEQACNDWLTDYLFLKCHFNRDLC